MYFQAFLCLKIKISEKIKTYNGLAFLKILAEHIITTDAIIDDFFKDKAFGFCL